MEAVMKFSEYPTGTVIRTKRLVELVLNKDGGERYPSGWYGMNYVSLEEADQLQAEGRAELVSVPWAVTKALVEAMRDMADNFGGGTTDEDEILRMAFEEAKE
jgi:hypothetical protein